VATCATWFYLLCGLGASAPEIATAANSTVPGLGASGAISGVLAAYLLLYPTSTVSTLLPISSLVIPIRLPAWLMIAGWFALQVVYGVASLNPNAGADLGGVAYWAHVGGFLTGATLIWLFQRPDYVRQIRRLSRSGGITARKNRAQVDRSGLCHPAGCTGTTDGV
jgi:membrane associated rhomboid family serine protease